MASDGKDRRSREAVNGQLQAGDLFTGFCFSLEVPVVEDTTQVHVHARSLAFQRLTESYTVYILSTNPVCSIRGPHPPVCGLRIGKRLGSFLVPLAFSGSATQLASCRVVWRQLFWTGVQLQSLGSAQRVRMSLRKNSSGVVRLKRSADFRPPSAERRFWILTLLACTAARE